MKKHTISLIACLLIPLAGVSSGETVEYVTVRSTADLNTSATDLIELVAHNQQMGHGRYIELEGWGSLPISGFIEYKGQMIPQPSKIGSKFTGVTQVRVSSTTIITLKITKNGATQSGATEAKVKVPTDATGDVQVVMESSEDGKTWVLAGPGPYPAKGSNLQFRIRIVTTQ